MSRGPLPLALTVLAEAQDGVLHRAQLRHAGVTRWAIRNHVQSGRWVCVGPRVVVLSTGVLTRRQRMWVAVLHAGVRSALAGRTALESYGLDGWRDERVHVVIPRGAPPVPRLPGLVRHESRRLTPADIVAAPLPRTRAGRAAIDAASWSRAPRSAVGIVAATVQQRLATTDQLRRELHLGGSQRHARLLRLSLDDIEGGSHALAEIDLVLECRRRGLPVPERQVIRTEGGRRRYLDAVFRRPDGSRLVVEVDGALHLQVARWWDDLDRQNELVIGGDLVLRFPSSRLRTEPDHCFGQLSRALAHRLAA